MHHHRANAVTQTIPTHQESTTPAVPTARLVKGYGAKKSNQIHILQSKEKQSNLIAWCHLTVHEMTWVCNFLKATHLFVTEKKLDGVTATAYFLFANIGKYAL